jgi:hypothetical protein
MLKLTMIVLLAAAFPCAGQTPFTVRVNDPINSTEVDVREVAIAATSHDWPELAIAWNGGYSISLDAGTTWPGGGAVLPALNSCHPEYQPLITGDPMVVASTRTNSIFVGQLHYYFTRNVSGFSVARKPPGQAVLTDRTTIICADINNGVQFDKGWLALGDYSGSEVLFLGYNISREDPPECRNLRNYSKMSSPSAPTGTVWDRPTYPISGDSLTCGDQGNGVANAATIGPNGEPLLFVAFNTNNINYKKIRPPVARWSTNYGEPLGSQSSWSNPQITFQAAITPGHAGTDGILPETCRNDDPNIPCTATVPGTFILQNFPAVAVDPNDRHIVYVVFCGACESTSADKLDLIVAKSLNGGQSFLATNTLHLTQSWLEAPSNTDQTFPAIVVDKFGGVNILWYQVMPDETDFAQAWARVGWCRIANFSAPFTPPKVKYLTPWWHTRRDAIGNTEYLGDYIGICSSGCFVFGGYMSCHENTWPNFYCTRLDLCTADVDTDGLVNSMDLMAFGNAYSAGSSTADLTEDQQVNGYDVLKFQEAYTCGCAAP